MNDKLAYQTALALSLFNLGLMVYCYSLHPHWLLKLFAGIFLAFAVRAVSELRRMKKFGVRA